MRFFLVMDCEMKVDRLGNMNGLVSVFFAHQWESELRKTMILFYQMR